jgi:hypothetical protein
MGAEREVRVEPVTLMAEGQIAGCGFSSTQSHPEGTVIGEVLALREGDGTVFSIRARTDGRRDGGEPAFAGVRLTTASHDTGVLFPPPAVTTGAILETRAPLEGFTGSSFVQELMVTGGRFEMRRADGRIMAYDLPRPMPHGVRQAYLNCAGDLFRPEDE